MSARLLVVGRIPVTLRVTPRPFLRGGTVVAMTQVAAPQAPKSMSKLFAFTVVAAVTVALPSVAHAGSVVLFPTAPGQTADFKPVNPLAAGDGAGGYWDNKSYDSWTQGVGSACNVAAIVAGGSCDWKAFTAPVPPAPYQQLSNPVTADPGSLQYYGRTDGATPDTPDNFYFTGPWALSFEVLFQLSAWDNTVEFGWYEAGNPDNRTPLLPLPGQPRGPYSDNLGATDPQGRTSANIPQDFGFYYRNTRYGSTPADEILFFTESRFNRIGNYFGYFSDPQSGLWQQTNLRFDDEGFFQLYGGAPQQQFALFTDASGRFWLGLEDQIGDITSAFCENRGLQPCSDYDHNDLIISIVPRPVPEPASVTLLAGGLLGAAWMRRRRQ